MDDLTTPNQPGQVTPNNLPAEPAAPPVTVPQPTPPEAPPTAPPTSEPEKPLVSVPPPVSTEQTTTAAGRFPKSPKKKIIAGIASLLIVVLGSISVATAWKLRQTQKVTPGEAEAWVGPACSGDCEIVVGPGNLTFEAAGHGFRWHCLSKSQCAQVDPQVKNADIYVPYPAGATVKEVYAIWSGEGCHTPNEDCAGENHTTVNVNGHSNTAIKTFVAQNPKFPGNTQAANIAKLKPASIPSPEGGKLKFHVLSLGDFYANGHGMSIIVIYEKQGFGYNKIILRLWGEWLYMVCAPFDDRAGCGNNHSTVMDINLPDLDTTRLGDNKFAWFAGEGELDSRDTSKKEKACIDDETSKFRTSHLYYQVPGGNWTMLPPTDSPPAPAAWFACPMDPGAWWVSRVTGVNMPKINLTGNSIKFAADSASVGDERVDGESYTFVGAVAQYPVAEPPPPPGCWETCAEDADCPKTPNVLMCQDVEGTKRCVNPACSSQENCECPPLLCLDLTATPSADLAKDDEVELTCKGSSGADQPINHVEFRAQIDGGSWTSIGTATVTKTDGEYQGNKNYTIPQTGNYQIECRVCTSTDDSACTEWGKAGVASP